MRICGPFLPVRTLRSSLWPPKRLTPGLQIATLSQHVFCQNEKVTSLAHEVISVQSGFGDFICHHTGTDFARMASTPERKQRELNGCRHRERALNIVRHMAPCAAVSPTDSPADRLRQLLASSAKRILVMPCCYDALTAKLVERAGFPLTFVSGFAVSAAHGMPDTQLISYNEMLNTMRDVCSTLQHIPCMGDGDTGYGLTHTVSVGSCLDTLLQAMPST